MVASKADLISRGGKKYLAGIKALGGATEYRKCGAEGGMDTAICLAGLSEALSTEDDWARRWERAMA